MDYLWKSENLIDHEMKVEIGKIKPQFRQKFIPGNPLWEIRTQGIREVFPTLIATSNLFLVISLLEVQLLTLCNLIESACKGRFDEAPGSGIQRCLKFIRKEAHFDYEKNPFWEPLHAATLIRNCFSHAFGILKYSKDQEKIISLLRDKKYWVKMNRDGSHPNSMVYLTEKHIHGKQLAIESHYPWLLYSYSFELLIRVCEHLLEEKLHSYYDSKI
jgi:hypothetical protein